jgi:hypothetical protein
MEFSISFLETNQGKDFMKFNFRNVSWLPISQHLAICAQYFENIVAIIKGYISRSAQHIEVRIKSSRDNFLVTFVEFAYFASDSSFDKLVP